MALNFNAPAFLRDVAPMLRREKYKYKNKDNMDRFVLLKRKAIDPEFVIPEANLSRWQPIPSGSDSDSAQSEVDSDEDSLPFQVQMSWIDELLNHLTVIFNALNNEQGRAWAIEFATVANLSMKQQSKLNIL